MNYRYLGRSALKVSPLCLGAMMFGGETDESTSQRIIHQAFDQGINFIDTADVYHAGRSEEVVGRAIAEQRDSWVVATKFGYPSVITSYSIHYTKLYETSTWPTLPFSAVTVA